MKSDSNFEQLDIYVWEGKADIVERVARCMSSFDVEVARADGMALGMERDAGRASP